MNLSAIANSVITAVNPNILGTIVQSTGGYTTNAAGHRTSNYNTILDVPMQVQAVAPKQLEHIDSLNIEGEKRAVWLNGDYQGVVQAKGLGGDFLQFLGSTWLVIWTPENWDAGGWSHVVVALQKNPPP